MKYLALCFLILVSMNSTAKSLDFGCGLGAHHQGTPVSSLIDEESANFLAIVDCHLINQPALQENGFFLTAPSLAIQASTNTNKAINHHHTQVNYQNVTADWLLFRHHEIMLGITARYLNSEQDVLLSESNRYLRTEQENLQLGLLVDTQLVENLISQVKIQRNKQQQPMRINLQDSSAIVSNSELESWQLSLAKHNPNYGLHWHWEFSLEAGKAKKSDSLSIAQINDTDFIGLGLDLGLIWRVRISPYWHAFATLSGQWQQWYFNDQAQERPNFASSHQFNYQSTLGLNRRF